MPSPGQQHAQSLSQRASRRSVGSWVLLGVPALLLLVLGWQLASTALRADTPVRDAVSVGRVSLEGEPTGARIDFVLVDRSGQTATLTGDLTIVLREPEGSVWQTTRSVTPEDFQPLATGGLLAGRLGYSVAIPTSAWLRSPRRGGMASVAVDVRPSGGRDAFSTVTSERFP